MLNDICLFRPLIKPKAVPHLPPPPDIPVPHRPSSQAGEVAVEVDDSPKRPVNTTGDSNDILDSSIKSLGGAEPAPEEVKVPRKDTDDSDSSETDTDEEKSPTSVPVGEVPPVPVQEPSQEHEVQPVQDGIADVPPTDEPVQEEQPDDWVDPNERANELDSSDLLPPPDTKAIAAATLWSDEPPAQPVLVIKTQKPAPKPSSHPFRLVLKVYRSSSIMHYINIYNSLFL